MGKYMEHAGIPGVTTCENKALSLPLSFDPGERWEYGINIDWAGKAVEAVSGKKLDAYLKDHIFTPLGMNSTGFKLTPDMRARLVGMHGRGADGSLTPTPFEMVQEPEFHMGGGGLYSTAGDYIRFIQMLLNGGTLNGNRVLKAETVKLMSQNHIGDLNVTPLRTALPEASNHFDPWPDQDKKWGLSFMINTQRTPEGRSPGSLGLGGPGEHVLLARPVAECWGRDPHADLALHRSEGDAAVRGVRARRLSVARWDQGGGLRASADPG